MNSDRPTMAMSALDFCSSTGSTVSADIDLLMSDDETSTSLVVDWDQISARCDSLFERDLTRQDVALVRRMNPVKSGSRWMVSPTGKSVRW